MTFSDIPEFIVSSEISICKGSYCDNVPERMINVEIQIMNNFMNSIRQKLAMKSTKKLGRKYVYSSTILEKNQWPKLKISTAFIRESLSFTKEEASQNDRNDSINSQHDRIILKTSLTQSLQRLSKEELQKIANQSPRTRPLRPPCFNPYVSMNRNIVIPTSDTPINELPHPLQSKTMDIPASYKYQKYQNNTLDDPFYRFNSYLREQTDSYYHQNIQKKKGTKQKGNVLAKTVPSKLTESTKTQNASRTPISTNKIEVGIPFSNDEYNINLTNQSIQAQQTVPLIFRTEMRKKKNNSSLKDRPYFTTCQEPLVKRAITFNEIANNTSYII